MKYGGRERYSLLNNKLAKIKKPPVGGGFLP
jgi:hypothetical protein